MCTRLRSNNVYIQGEGSSIQIFGTSCSTPETGGIIGLLNAYRLAEKKPVIGFFNPLLYQVYAEQPGAFNDITQGNNYCSLEECSGCTTGFAATPGWDAVTGVGSPIFSKLLDAVKAIDARREARIAAAAMVANQ